MDTADGYFDDELPSNDYTNEATIDSQATLPELEPVTTTIDNKKNLLHILQRLPVPDCIFHLSKEEETIHLLSMLQEHLIQDQ